MRKFLKWSAIIVSVVLVIGTGYGFLGLRETKDLMISPVNLASLPDGAYAGEYDCYRWTSRVEVTVKDHRIVAVKPLKFQDGRQRIINELIDRIKVEQRTDVDVRSGATADSKAFLKAIELALTGGK